MKKDLYIWSKSQSGTTANSRKILNTFNKRKTHRCNFIFILVFPKRRTPACKVYQSKSCQLPFLQGIFGSGGVIM